MNYLDVGSADKDILRIIALRDSVFFLKEDGIWMLTGEDISTYRVSLFDNTAVLIGADTAVPCRLRVGQTLNRPARSGRLWITLSPPWPSC